MSELAVSVLIRPSPASPATSNALRTRSRLLSRLMKALMPAAPTSAMLGAAERQHRPAAVGVRIIHPADRRDPPRRRLVVAAGKHRRDELRRILAELRVGVDERRGASDGGAHRFLVEAVLAGRKQLPDRGRAECRHPCRRTPAAAATRRCRQGRPDRSNRRSPNKDRPSTATRTRRGRQQSCAECSRCWGVNKGARAWNARSCGEAALISRSGGTIPVAVARPKRHAVRLSTGSHSMVAARPLPRRADDLFGKREVDAADAPEAAAHRRSAPTPLSDSPASDGAHCLHQPLDPRRRTSRSRPRAGRAPAGRRWPARSGRRPATIFGVKRSVSTPATSIRAASASPMRSSSHARSATQSTGFTWRGARGLASNASRSAICAQREASGVSIRRIRVDRNAPLAPPQGIGAKPELLRDRGRRPTHGSRRAQPGYSTGGAGGGSVELRLTSSTALSSLRRDFVPASLPVGGGGRRTDSPAGWRPARARAAAAPPAGRAPAARARAPRRRNQKRLNAHCPPGDGDFDRVRRLLLRQRRQKEQRADDEHDDDDEDNAMVRGMAGAFAEREAAV